MYHKPVLLNECIAGLAIRPDGIYVDVTFGGGGHSKEILRNLGEGQLVAFDQDEDAIANKPEDDRLLLVKSNFRYLKNFLQLYKQLPVDGILADLGISSHQIDDAERGFSTRFNADLDMRMDRNHSVSAKEVVNTYSFEQLKNIFHLYGELKSAYKIANHLINVRSDKEIATTNELKDVLSGFAPRNKEQKFYAQVFQALRIEVNEELQALREMLEQSLGVLKPGGRLVVISYHSLEDRLVKNFLKTGNFEGKLEKDFYGNPKVDFKLINKKPIVSTEKELEENTRSRSAKLRIAEKI